MIRSSSLPVKPRDIEELPPLERSEEREILFENYPSKHQFSFSSNESNIPYIDHNFEEYEKQHVNRISDEAQKINNKISINVPPIYNDRVIAQSGQHNVSHYKIPGRSLKYMKDFITTLIEQKWSYTFFIFLSTFFLTWILFTGLWYLIAYAHGDLNFDEESGVHLIEGQQPCVIGAHSFTGLFIYTVETQVSIGFGEKYPSDECPEGVFLFVAQLIVYIGLEGAMVGIVFAKVARPSKQISEARFSKKAVICQRDKKLCLVIRVCDDKEQQAIGTKVQLFLLQDKRSLEGESLGKCLTELKIDNSCSPFILWPTTICHYIDKQSPFYRFSPKQFATNEFEVIVLITGSSPSTGQITESRTSYLPMEIYWGESFVNIIHYNAARNIYETDTDNFNSTVAVTLPYDSACNMEENDKESKPRKRYSTGQFEIDEYY